MVRAFLLFASVFGLIFTLIWAASFTGYFDKVRVRNILRVVLVAAVTIFFTLSIIAFIFGLEHTVF